MLDLEYEVYESAADRIAMEQNSKKWWQKFEHFYTAQRETTKKYGLRDSTGEMKFTNNEIAEIHASKLEDTHSETENPDFDDRFKRAVQNEVQARENELSPSESPDLHILFREPVKWRSYCQS